MRVVLSGRGILHDDEPLHQHDDVESNSLQLRVAAIFVIFAASLLGALPPLLSAKFGSPSAYVGSALRAFAGGVILALSLVHIVPASVQELSEVASFPFSGLLLLAGVSTMVFTEHGLQALYREREATDADHASTTLAATGSKDLTLPELHACVAGHINAADTQCPHGGGDMSKVAAWLMELGCVFHSVIIGVDLGVTTETSVLTPLFVALIFHQMVEGISLGTVVATARFTKAKSFAMALVYSITTPVGVAVGIAVSYDPGSRHAIITKGCLDSLAGGLLLYIALVHLMCPEFCANQRVPRRQRVVAYLSFALGAAIMCTLALWA
jgi:solute carrier family 39 (zinc transporter), member 1/2/3